MAGRKSLNSRGIFWNFPLYFAGKATSLEFRVVEKMAIDMIIFSATLEALESRLDIGHSFLTVKLDGKEVVLGF